MPAWLVRLSRSCEGRAGASSPDAAAFSSSADLRLRFGEGQFAGGGGRFVGGEVALRKGDFGVVLGRAGVGRRVGLFGRAAGHHQRIERRHRVGEGIGGERQRRRQDRERPHPHDLLVADLDRRRRFVGLLGGDDVDRPDQPVALARIDALGLLVADQIGEFRRFGEIRLAVEVEVERGADQRQAGEAGERDPGEPAQRDAPTLAAVDARFADLDRRLVAELDDRGGACRSARRRGRVRAAEVVTFGLVARSLSAS